MLSSNPHIIFISDVNVFQAHMAESTVKSSNWPKRAHARILETRKPLLNENR